MKRLDCQEELNIGRKEVEAYLDELYSRFKNKEGGEQLKSLAQQFVETMVVYEEEIEVILKITLVTGGGGGPYHIKSTAERLELKNYCHQSTAITE
ncbi:hypothetical protein [Desulfofundulus salinus]|uniref:Uncharacterized protein n=1 Tax=Desulfofundulus salinus TaxID=2419843 RepID=A0A494WWB5_9FIRM|nr:hypothetical protein [Desulfofundulus salinum]RKO67799.1 hypothetical protein D7024_13150 [Desulfofundulus salinum]